MSGQGSAVGFLPDFTLNTRKIRHKPTLASVSQGASDPVFGTNLQSPGRGAAPGAK
jgi:hypothetical protein